RAGSNPGNVGHNWVKNRFKIDQIPSGTILQQRFPDGSTKLRIFIPAFLTDNPHLDANYAASLELLPEHEKLAKKYSNWNIYEGQVFDDWRISPLAGEPPTAQHVIQPYEIPDYWPIILAVDWGYTAMTYA